MDSNTRAIYFNALLFNLGRIRFMCHLARSNRHKLTVRARQLQKAREYAADLRAFYLPLKEAKNK